MRVARVITRLNRGGPARTLLAVEPILRRQGVESLLLCGAAGAGEEDLAGEFRAAGIEVRRVDGLRRELRPWRDLAVRRALARELDAFAPDVVHTHTFKAGLLARTARLARPARRIHTFHGHLFEGAFPRPASVVLAAVERRLARRTDLVFAVSERVRADLCDEWRIAPRERTEVLPGVLLPELSEPPAAGEREAARAALLPALGPWIGTLARLVAVKAPLHFLDVAERVRRARPDARFVWVGDGAMRGRFLDEVARRGLAEAVRFVGWQRDVRRWHLALDVEVLLSDQEGLPLSLIEARALRLPVVASAVGGVADLLRGHEPARLVARRDAGAAAAAIVELLRPDAASPDAGAPSRSPPAREGGAHPWLSPLEHARRLEDAYRRVVERAPAASGAGRP